MELSTKAKKPLENAEIIFHLYFLWLLGKKNHYFLNTLKYVVKKKSVFHKIISVKEKVLLIKHIDTITERLILCQFRDKV